MRRLRAFSPFALIVLLLVAHAFFYVLALGGDAVDDAYISFRYAQNAILGHGLVFNPGERVEGFTNFLWTAMMLPLEGLGVDVGRASMLLGLLLALATLWLVARFQPSPGDPPAGAARLAALLLAVDGTFALWAVGGLETPLFAFLVFAGAVLYIREQRADTLPYSGVFFALAAMTRPEGLLVFGITVAHQALWRVLAERRLVTWRDIGRVAAFAGLFVPYWLGRWTYYRSFLPNSFHAKVSIAGPEAQLERGWRHLAQFVGVHLGWLALVPAVVALAGRQWIVVSGRWSEGRQKAESSMHRHQNGAAEGNGRSSLTTDHRPLSTAFWTTYFASLLLPYAAYIVYVGGDWSVGRFFVPLLAPFYLLFSTGLVDMWKGVLHRVRRQSGQRVEQLGRVAAVGLAGLFLLASSWNGEYGIFIRGFDAATATAARETMGKWLGANAPRGTLIAVDAAGQVPYFSGLPAIDMFGINDLHIGRLPVATLGQGTPGHEKFDLIYVVNRAPTYVVIYGTVMDGVVQYERAPVTWTENAEYLKFLTLYKRKD